MHRSQHLRTTAYRIRAEFLFDLVKRVTEFLFRVSWATEELQLLWVSAISVEITCSDADQPDLLLQGKLDEQRTSDIGNLIPGLNEPVERLLLRVSREARVS